MDVDQSDVSEVGSQYDEIDSEVDSQYVDEYIKREPRHLPVVYLKEIVQNFIKFQKETDKQERAKYREQNIKYITNYMYNMLWDSNFDKIFENSMRLCDSLLE
jgi:glutaredoxin